MIIRILWLIVGGIELIAYSMNRYQPMRDKEIEQSTVNNRNSLAVSCCERLVSPTNHQRSSSVHTLTNSQLHNYDSVSRSPLFGSLLAAQRFTRHHPYLSTEKPGWSSLYHSQHTRMGNQHGKITVNGEQYDNNKAQQIFNQLRTQLEFVKVTNILNLSNNSPHIDILRPYSTAYLQKCTWVSQSWAHWYFDVIM